VKVFVLYEETVRNKIFLCQQTVGNREPLFPTVCWERKIPISDRLLQENTIFSQNV